MMTSDADNDKDVLQEAQEFLKEMVMSEDEALDAANLDATDGFAIDSDDEEEEEAVPLINESNDEELKKKNQETSTSNGRLVTDSHPLQEELVAPPQPTSTPPTTQDQQQYIQEKAMTFASQMASFAQRAASQIDKMSDKVASATVTTTSTMDAVPPSIPQEELDNDTKAALIRQHLGTLLKGERVIMFLAHLIHVGDSTEQNFSTSTPMWCCAMTYYRLVLFHTSGQINKLQMPLASIDKVEKSVYTTTGSKPTTLMGLTVYGKDNGRQIKFTTPSYADTLRAHEALQTYAFPGRRNLGYLFAFESKRQDVMSSLKEKKVTLPPTRLFFAPIKEFTRLGILEEDGPWKLYSNANAQYQLCMTYPNEFVGMACLEESNPESMRLVRQCAAFRSEQRLPALTWGASDSGGSLWRASQPKVGLQGNRSSADEEYLKKICESAVTANNKRQGGFQKSEIAKLVGSNNAEWINPGSQLKILDLRPKSSAMANRTGGYGYENTTHYSCATIQFCNIGNIHAVRDAYQKLSALCLSPSVNDTTWMQSVEDTKWLTQIRLILAASWQAAFWIHVHGLPVLLHCSHGWDRTSQVAALCQLLLDPYYRSLEGFATLVQKDFMSFGHPFHTRCAHGEGRGEQRGTSVTVSGSAADEGQISPIFLQFLDCVYQMVHEYPEQFEFNTKFLLLVSEHVYSCRFGTMLCDCEREREAVAGIRQRTHCLWEYLMEKPELKSVVYRKDSKDKLWMPQSALLRNVVLWADRHCMYGPKETQLRRDNAQEFVTAEDYHVSELVKAKEEAEEWKRIAQERLEELDALRKIEEK